jgi:hypothetical protein
MRKWKWIGHTLRNTRITSLDRDWTGTHRENEGRLDQDNLEENNFSGTTRTECLGKRPNK